MTRYWCGVVSREHIKLGEQGGFCQVCHGKRAPLERMSVGDGIVFYSPVFHFNGKDKCQSFTAIGTITGEKAYQFQMTPSFIPYRRDVAYQPCIDVPIHPLLDKLSFTAGNRQWGYQFRFGHFAITADDFLLLAKAMLPGNEQTLLTTVPPRSLEENLDLFS